jgi:hypothetical protein
MKYSASILREKRNIKEAKLFCDEIFNSIPKEEFESFVLKKGKDRFYKDFWDEYYPLYLYSCLKYSNEDYIIFLCENGSKIDAQITNSNGHCIETIQITTASFDYNNALKNEKLYKEGFSLGVGSFNRNKDGSISQRRAMRSEDTALHEESNQIIKALNKKMKNNTYENIDVLLVVTESRFNKVIKDYYKKLTSSLSLNQQKRFKELYLIDYSNVLIKLS